MRLTLLHASGPRPPRGARRMLEALAGHLPPSGLRLQVVVGGDALLRRLNRRFRGRDRVTDVLSFRYESTPGRATGDPDAEIYVSLPRAARQARERGHGLLQETVLLVLHGMLHVTGHDHHAPAETRRMRAAEQTQLRWLARRWPRLRFESVAARAGPRRRTGTR